MSRVDKQPRAQIGERLEKLLLVRMTMEARSPVPPHVAPDRVFDFDIFVDPRVDQDVQGCYSRILKDAPDVFWTPRNGGHWMVHRFDTITAIVTDPEHFSCREMQIPRAPNRTILIPLNLDPPDNAPYRKALMPFFSARAIRAMEPALRSRAVELVEEIAQKGECDFAYDVAARYPVSIFMDMMGLPLHRLRSFRLIAEQYFAARTLEDYAATEPLIVGIMTDLIELRRKEPGDDLLSHLLSVDVEGRKLVAGELLSICILLFLGGMDTVTNVLGFTYQYFAQDGALQERLSDHPELIPEFVEEALRLYAVVSNPRVVAKDCERFGVTFLSGDMVSCVLAMAGRDERVNPDPNTFRLDRTQKRHLAFSTGPHMCLGHILARAELRILTEEWLKRVPRFAPVTGASHRFRLGNVNALSSLPLRWPARH